MAASRSSLVVGLVAGLSVAVLIGAGPADAGKAKKLTARVAYLETRLVEVSDELDEVGTRLDQHDELTQLLDVDGTYYGYVNSVQVWSHYCNIGDGAVWNDYDGYAELSCSAKTSAAARRHAPVLRGAAIEREQGRRR